LKVKKNIFVGNGLASDFENSNWWVPVDYKNRGMAVDVSNAMAEKLF